MALKEPVALQNASGADRPDAPLMRLLFNDGFNAGAEGITSPTAFKVSQKSGTPDMSVDIAAGSCWVDDSLNALAGQYWEHNDGVVNVSVSAADGSNPRYTYIILQIDDDSEDGGGFNRARLITLDGAPAASPARPSVAALDNFYVLAEILIPAGDTALTDSQITDRREYAFSYHEPWTNYTPSWTASSSPAIGNGLLEGRFCREPGNTLKMVVQVDPGSTTTFGSGEWSFGLPTGITVESPNADGYAVGKAYGLDSGTSHHTGTVLTGDGETRVSIMPATSAGAGWGDTVPFTWVDADHFGFSAEMQVAGFPSGSTGQP